MICFVVAPSYYVLGIFVEDVSVGYFAAASSCFRDTLVGASGGYALVGWFAVAPGDGMTIASFERSPVCFVATLPSGGRCKCPLGPDLGDSGSICCGVD
jgi:hypothetical protein